MGGLYEFAPIFSEVSLGVDLGVSLRTHPVSDALDVLALAEFLGAGVDFVLEFGVISGGVFEGLGEGVVFGPGFFVLSEFVEDEGGDFEEFVGCVHGVVLCFLVSLLKV